MNLRYSLGFTPENHKMFEKITEYYRRKHGCHTMIGIVRYIIVEKYHDILSEEQKLPPTMPK